MKLFNRITSILALVITLTIVALAVDRHFLPFSLTPNYPALAQRLGHSVVFIGVYSSEPDEKDELAKLLRDFNGKEEPPEPEMEQKGLGSGFIWTADGYIITNAHVVNSAEEVRIVTARGDEYVAEVKGIDERSDVAVLKINETGLKPVVIGSSDDTMVGESVMAIGSPFGLDKTVTVGIVSAKSRETGDYIPSIQTDVAINPGNSGGPLINKWGQVIGINSAIYSRSGGYQGIAFAIPIDDAIKIAEQLRDNGKVTRGYIGLAVVPVTEKTVKEIGLDKIRGLQVKEVKSGKPADLAGIQVGDIILSINNRPVDRAEHLVRIVGNTAPGTMVKLVIFRNKEYVNVDVVLVEAE